MNLKETSELFKDLESILTKHNLSMVTGTQKALFETADEYDGVMLFFTKGELKQKNRNGENINYAKYPSQVPLCFNSPTVFTKPLSYKDLDGSFSEIKKSQPVTLRELYIPITKLKRNNSEDDAC